MARENTVVSEILSHLKKFNSITLTLQNKSIILTHVRYLFNKIIYTFNFLVRYLDKDLSFYGL